ncbi:MAG: hypothetical protein B7Y41_09875 [Hydrogenophilales bacterium 28-61-23]|nr:MAG: hypothetical protein B7Y41_09875 [Hydrogenophilales bacterium 28-61-23]
MTTRQVVLVLALAATLAAVWLAEEGELGGAGDAGDAGDAVEETVIVESSPRRRPAGAALNAATARQTETRADSEMGTNETAARFAVGGADLFPVQSWKPPPPPAPIVVAPPPPPPQAPPLPFKFVGRWDGGDGELFFLAQGEKTVTLRAGQTLAQWRLDSIAANTMNFTYVPLQQQRQLRFGP